MEKDPEVRREMELVRMEQTNKELRQELQETKRELAQEKRQHELTKIQLAEANARAMVALQKAHEENADLRRGLSDDEIAAIRGAAAQSRAQQLAAEILGRRQ
jgi:hypothetical protein